MTSGAVSAAPGGMKVNVDPTTGRLLETPPPDSDPQAASPRAAEPPPIVMEPSPIPGGGVGFRVPDEYHAELRATTTPDGNAHVACEAPAK